jgi:raffinose/stachyose/melibiose transport system substrate-binding protein
MKPRNILAACTALVIATGMTACGGGGDTGGDTGSDSGGPVQMTMWHNSTTGDGKAFWAKTVADFEAVKISVQAIQNEDMDGKLQTALNSGAPPDIFMARGGGKLADIVDAEQVMDISDKVDPATKAAVSEGVLNAFTVDGKLYGMPTAVLPGGMYYSKDLFKKAGITGTPKTMSELEAAVGKLKAAGIQPIALGAKDAWPAAHYYYFFALRDCSKDVMDKAAEDKKFDDPCWTKAGQGAGSSAGLLANHKTAMELMGAWEPGVVASLTPDKKPLSDLGWFPFPSVDGGQGDPAAMMGGVDGYACSAKAPKECPAFLNFYMQKKYQENYAKAFQTLPASKDAQGVVKDPALQAILTSYNNAPYVQVWLDTLYGQNVGNALNSGVVNMLAGKGDAAGIVKTVTDAAAKG